jgi:hypothetical protein
MKLSHKLLLLILVLALGGLAYWKFAIPTHRIVIHSELIMLGDANGDHHWTVEDEAAFDAFVSNPSRAPDALVWQLDINQNG